MREELSSTTKALDNLIRAIEQGLPFSDSIARRLNENEERKKALLDAIEAEETRARVAQDESSIKAFFEKYANADFDDPETRDTVLSYLIDKIYLCDDGHFKVAGWYWDFEHEIKSDLFEDLPERASGFEYSLDLDPEGFACFADGLTAQGALWKRQ